MSDFDSRYYADHAYFLYSLYKSHHTFSSDSECGELLCNVSKEVLLRDCLSRLYYTTFLKSRDAMYLPVGAMHTTVSDQLSPEYYELLNELKSFRTRADYYTRDSFTSPLRNSEGIQRYPDRLLGIMETFLEESAEGLAKNHVTLQKNKETMEGSN